MLGSSRNRAQRRDASDIGMRGKKGQNLVLDLGRVGAAVEHRVAQIHAQTIGKTTATLGQCGLLDGLIDAEEGCNAVPFGAHAGGEPGVIFRLADIHQRADLAGLLGGACVLDDEVDSLIYGRLDPPKHTRFHFAPGCKNVVLIAGCVVQKAAL